MLESSNMINFYVDYKTENINLKHEIESLKKRVSDKTNEQIDYEVFYINLDKCVENEVRERKQKESIFAIYELATD